VIAELMLLGMTRCLVESIACQTFVNGGSYPCIYERFALPVQLKFATPYFWLGLA
jgi:hypothetical protein